MAAQNAMSGSDERVTIRGREARSNWQNSMEFVERAGLADVEILAYDDVVMVDVDNFMVEFDVVDSIDGKSVERAGIAQYERFDDDTVIQCDDVDVEANDVLYDAMREAVME